MESMLLNATVQAKRGRSMTDSPSAVSHRAEAQSFPKGAAVVLGRVFFSLIFLLAGFNHFSKQTIAYAASQGAPLASIAVPLSGILAIVGSLSVFFGYRAKIGAWLIVLFLVPVTFMMHRFWLSATPWERSFK